MFAFVVALLGITYNYTKETITQRQKNYLTLIIAITCKYTKDKNYLNI